MTRKDSFFNSQYLIAALVVILSAGLGALTMGALAGGWATADAANPTLKSAADKKEKNLNNLDVTRKFDTAPFSRIISCQAIEVELTQAPYPGFIEVTAPAYTLRHLKVENERGTLTLHYADFDNPINGKTIVRISAGNIDELSAVSASKITVKDRFDIAVELRVIATSAGEISFGEVTGRRLTIEATSAAEIFTLVADVDEVNVKATSAADVRLRGINAGSVKAAATTAANVVLSGRCNFSSVDATTGGEVTVRGLILEKQPLRPHSNASVAGLRQP